MVIEMLDDGESSPVAMRVGPSLAAAIRCAALVHARKDELALSFNSLLLGLAATDDEIGRWWNEQIAPEQLDALSQEYGVADLQAVRALATDGNPQPLRRTRSVRVALDEAERLAKALDELVETRHVAAAYVWLPSYHDREFARLHVRRRALARSLSQLLSRHHPERAQSWERLRPQLDLALDLGPSNLKSHVRDALSLASALAAETAAESLADEAAVESVSSQRIVASAAGRPTVEAHHVLAAVALLGPESKSKAFRRFAELANLEVTRPTGTLGSPDPSQISAPLQRMLGFGQQPLDDETERHQLWGRDLVTAALLCDDGALDAMFERQGRTLRQIRDRWYAFVSSSDVGRPRETWRDWWRFAGVALPEPLRAVYVTETSHGRDRLGIDVEARAFARLILDKDVKAPLSIGLLGDWGSGKSFFIEEIKRQMATLKEERRSELYRHVVEIEFNAWHASDANLWASLVTNIFDEIWSKVRPDGNKSLDEARRALVRKIEEANGAVHEANVQVALASNALTKAEEELSRKRQKLAWRGLVQSVAVEQLKKVAEAAGFRKQLDTINEVEDALDSLASSSTRLRLALASLLEAPISGLLLPALVCAAAAVGLWLWISKYGEGAWQQLARWVTLVGSGLAAMVAPIRIASGRVSSLAGKLQQIRGEYNQRLQEIAKSAPADAKMLTELRRGLTSAEASVAAAKARLAELLQEQATLDPRRRLGVFLQERVQSTQYRSQQGIISLVHRDFRELSKHMQDLRETRSTDSTITPFDRIVIFVDDLDRCRPDQVVHMLEAVQLLLALDLFVVVVAVDARWLMKALEVHYKEMLGAPDGHGERAATAQSYLEKIFQITYALGPMDPARFAGYVEFLAGKGGPAHSTVLDDVTSTDAGNHGDGVAPSATRADDGPARASAVARVQRAMPPIEAVTFSDAERALMCDLVPLLPTPRIAKRLVNVFRLIKAGKSIDELEELERTGRSRSCLVMLATLFGHPLIASGLLRALHQREPPFDKPDARLVDAMRGGGRDRRWKALADVIAATQIDISVGEAAREPIEIARYSLVSGHDWHTWTMPLRAPNGSFSETSAHEESSASLSSHES